ncbi:MAG: hypothetical protein KC912_16550, partial [Proteobacteria bacterium]|nr:hypothetical protein [Pseudomonadota bacterium]
VTGEEVARLRGHQRGARSVAFSADDATLASVDTDGKVRFWDLTLVTAEPEFLLAEAQRRFGATPAASTIHYGGRNERAGVAGAGLGWRAPRRPCLGLRRRWSLRHDR